MSNSNGHRTPTHFADLGDVEEHAARLTQAQIECRSRGHNMTDHDVDVDENNHFVVVERCRRCGLKYTGLVVDGEGIVITRPKTEYPEGYLLPRGTGRVSSAGRGVYRARRLENNWRKKAERRSR